MNAEIGVQWLCSGLWYRAVGRKMRLREWSVRPWLDALQEVREIV